MSGKIDRVLVDAPCSGLGTLRRNPDLKWRQSPQIVQELATLQAAILKSAARLLKPGGRLVYATCSLLPQENEAVAEAFSAANPEFAVVEAGDLLRQVKVDGPNGAGGASAAGGFVNATGARVAAGNAATGNSLGSAEGAPSGGANVLVTGHFLCAGGESGQKYLRLWPHRHQTDGFFAAIWQKL